MSIYSGFATRIQQQTYDDCLDAIVYILQKRILKFYHNQPADEEKFISMLSKIHYQMKQMESHKYLEPKSSNTFQQLLNWLKSEKERLVIANNKVSEGQNQGKTEEQKQLKKDRSKSKSRKKLSKQMIDINITPIQHLKSDDKSQKLGENISEQKKSQQQRIKKFENDNYLKINSQQAETNSQNKEKQKDIEVISKQLQNSKKATKEKSNKNRQATVNFYQGKGIMRPESSNFNKRFLNNRIYESRNTANKSTDINKNTSHSSSQFYKITNALINKNVDPKNSKKDETSQNHDNIQEQPHWLSKRNLNRRSSSYYQDEVQQPSSSYSLHQHHTKPNGYTQNVKSKNNDVQQQLNKINAMKHRRDSAQMRQLIKGYLNKTKKSYTKGYSKRKQQIDMIFNQLNP